MKLLRAILRPFKLDEVKGYGHQRGHAEVFRGAKLSTEFVPKIALDVVVPDALLRPALEVLERTLRTGQVGDGKIFVSQVEEAIRVRTNERGDAAL